MWRNFRLYARFGAQNLRAQLEYKNDFLISTISGIAVKLVGLVFLFVLFGNIRTIAGWTLYEVALLYGCMMIGDGALSLLFHGTFSLYNFVHTGQFDRFLLRPMSVVVQLMSASIDLSGLGTLATGIVLIAVSFGRLDSAPSALLIAVFAGNLALGIAIRANLNLATNAAAFWLHAANGVTSMIYYTQDFAKYPITIYPLAIRIVLLTILPHAMISYVPVCLLLGRLPLWPFVLAVPASLAFMVLVRRFVFGRALQQYESTGN